MLFTMGVGPFRVPFGDPILWTYLLILAVVILFVTEIVPVPVTAMGAATAAVGLGLVTPAQGLSGFSNEATIAVLAMLILAAAVQRSGLVNLLAHRLIDISHARAGRFLLLLILVAGAMSAFVSNTPIVAILIPLVLTVTAQLKESASKYLIPMAYASTLGGMVTLIGTSTTILASSVSEDLGLGAFGMFLFTPVGLAVFAAGGLYLLLVAPRLIPERIPAAKAQDAEDLRTYLFEVLVEPKSPLIGQRPGKSMLKVRYDIDMVRIIRGQQAFDPPLRHVIIREGDILLIRAPREEVLRIRADHGINLRADVVHGDLPETDDLVVGRAIVAPGTHVAGATLRELHFRERYDAVVLAVKKRSEVIGRSLSSVRLQAGDSLLLSGRRRALQAMARDPDFILSEELPAEQFRRNKIPLVLAVFALVIAGETFDVVPLAIGALMGVVVLVAAGALTVHEFQEAIRWDVVFLLAGLIPLGVAMQNTGAAAYAAERLVALIQGWPPMAILAVAYLATLVFTEIMSNSATVVLMLPLATEMATALGLNPFSFVAAVTFAATLAFMSPIGYQTYLMVYAPGGYRFTDFVRVGAPLNAICMVVCLAAIAVLWPL